MFLMAVALTITSCSTTGGDTSKSTTATEKNVAAKSAPAPAAGAQLWAQNCGHCHNIRSPGSYSDSQWDVVALHMRVRGNLTAEEHKQILAFLKSAH